MEDPDGLRDHQARCRPYLLELRMLTRDQAAAAPARQLAAEIGQVTGAILAEVEAVAQAASAVTTGSCHGPGVARLLEARLARLHGAARAAIAAAREEDTAGLRHQVRRFEALISAMWTVHSAVSGGGNRGHGAVGVTEHRVHDPRRTWHHPVRVPADHDQVSAGGQAS